MNLQVIKPMAFSLLIAACSSSITEEEAIPKDSNDWSWPGTYTYVSIEKNGASVGTYSELDSMLLTDTAFLYDIESIDKTFDIILTKYTSPNTFHTIRN